MALRTLPNRITKIKQKVENGAESFPIGTYPYLIDGIRGSVVNNLEEQLLIGGESTVVTWIDENGISHTETDYCTPGSIERHYKVEILDYSERNIKDYSIIDNEDSKTLILPDNVVHDGKIEIPQFLSDIYNLTEDSLLIDPVVKIKEVNLYYGNELLMKKVYTEMYVENKKIVKAIITKY